MSKKEKLDFSGVNSGKEENSYLAFHPDNPQLKKHHPPKSSDDETANLMREKRLDAKFAEKTAQDNAVRAEENKMSRTQEALGHLGAGKQYGE